MQAGEELKIRNDWLLVFMDETGHETFAGDHPYYAVGGCGILGAHHDVVKALRRPLQRELLRHAKRQGLGRNARSQARRSARFAR